jgi:hypothetical protein
VFKTEFHAPHTHVASILNPKEESDADQFFNFLEEVIAKDEFSLILITEGSKSFSPENKIKMNTWFKNNKKNLAHRCTGLVRVSQNQTTLSRLSSKALSLAMPCPYKTTNSLEEALHWIKNR